MEENNGTKNQNNFCPYCGSAINKETGICPYCTIKKTKQKNTMKKEPRKANRKPASLLTTILLAFCLFITSTFAIVIYDVRNVLKEDNATKLIDNIDNIDLGELIDNLGSGDNNDLNRFYDFLKTHDIKMTNEKLLDFIQNSTIKDFLGEKIGEFTEDFFKGDAQLIIERIEIEELLYQNGDYIYDEFGVQLYDSEIQKIAIWITAKDKMVQDEMIIIDSAEIKEVYPGIYYAIYFSLSYVTMAIFILLSLLILFFMIRDNVQRAVSITGIYLIIFGSVTIIPSILINLIPPVWEDICDESIVTMIIGNIIAINIWSGILFLIIGISALVVKNLINKYRSNKLVDKTQPLSN